MESVDPMASKMVLNMCKWEDTISTVTLISTETQTELSLLDLKNTESSCFRGGKEEFMNRESLEKDTES